jgi:TPR repeat protein
MHVKQIGKSLGLLAIVIAGCGTGGAAEHVRPKDPTAAGALGEGACHDVAAGAEPLVVDWKSEQRGDLEVAMKDGLAVVSFSCKGIKVLNDCHIDGSYAFTGMTKKEEVVRLNNSDEVQANLPLTGATIGGGLARDSSIDIAMVMVGKRRTTWREPTKQDLQGQCDGATHFVRAATVGAFAMETGTKAKVRAAAEILGAGASGESKSEKSTANRDGDPKACASSSPDAKAPPEQCGAAIRLVLAPIHAATDKPPEKPVSKPDIEVATCPDGLVRADGKCAKPADAPSYLCKGSDAAECKTQCDKGNAGSCGVLGRLLLRDDAGKAKELLQKGCDGDDATSCDALGVLLAKSDAAKAATLFAKACDASVATACTHLGSAVLEGAGTDKSADKALELFTRGCDGGDAEGCAQAAARLHAGTSAEDQGKAFQLDNRACQGGVTRSCVIVGKAYDGGSRFVGKNELIAQMSFRRACYRGDADGCFELGRSLYVQNPQEAKNNFQVACMRNVIGGCAALKVLYGENRAVIVPPAIRNPLEKSCMAGSALDCAELGLLDLSMNNKITAVQLQRACTMGQKFACKLAEKAK